MLQLLPRDCFSYTSTFWSFCRGREAASSVVLCRGKNVSIWSSVVRELPVEVIPQRS